MSSAPAVDRRRKRHQETADEVLAVAVEVMAEMGAAGMTLGEVARRMGVRPPSLYVYFPSKAALCDAIFERGWREAAEAVSPLEEALAARPDVSVLLTGVADTFVTWAVEHPGFAQLMFWRPVPSWEPSSAAYGPALELRERMTGMLRELRRQGGLRRDLDVDEAADAWTVLLSGLISQLLANEPGVPLLASRFGRLVPPVVRMFLAEYAAPPGRRKR